MAGILLASGQTYVVDAMKFYINNFGGLYVGLMTNTSNPSEGQQLGAGITELSSVTCSGYARKVISTWNSTTGVDPQLSGASVATFNVSGVWATVEGYFVSKTLSGNDALWAEVFPVGKGGDKNNGDTIIISPVYEQQYRSEP